MEARAIDLLAVARAARDGAACRIACRSGGERDEGRSKNRLRQEIAALRKSTSWRIMAPFRSIAATLKELDAANSAAVEIAIDYN